MSDSLRPAGLMPMMLFVVAGGVLGVGGELSASEGPARLILFGMAYLWAALWLLVNVRQALPFASGSWTIWLLPAYALLSAAWSLYPQKTLIDAGHLWGATLVALAAVTAAWGSVRVLSVALLTASLTVLAISLASVHTGQPFAIDPELGRWTGTTGNANTLGMFCVLAIAASSHLFVSCRSLRARVALIAALLLAGVDLRGSGSATSLVVSLLAAAGMCWLLIGRGDREVRTTGRVFAAFGLLALAALLLLLIAPEWLQLQTYIKAVGRSENFTGRESLWAFAWEQFDRQPWLGHGFDSLASVLTKVNMGVGQLHNGYLDLLVRGGVVGMGLLAAMTLAALFRALAVRVRDTGPVWAIVLMAAVLVHNIAEASLVRSTHSLWLVYLVAAFVATHSITSAHAQAGIQSDVSSDAHSAGAPALPNLLR